MQPTKMADNELQPKVMAVSWKEDFCILLDQTKLPGQELYLVCRRYEEIIEAIKRLAVRGAPALGVAGAYGCALAVGQTLEQPEKNRSSFLNKAFSDLENARPTAVNLKWAIDRMRRNVHNEEISSRIHRR